VEKYRIWERGWIEWETEATCINAPWAQNQHFTAFWEKETFLWSEDKRIKREAERKNTQRERERKKGRSVQGRARFWNKSGILFIIFSRCLIFILSQEVERLKEPDSIYSLLNRRLERWTSSMKNCMCLCLNALSLSCPCSLSLHVPNNVSLTLFL